MVILSPHLDDAALSCWHLLAGPGDVRVINVFDGLPPARTAPPWWDTITGATDARTRVRERHEEDAAALGELGRRATGLGLLDGQYRHGDPDPGDIADAIDDALGDDGPVYAPAGIDDDHIDHALVRAAAIRLAVAGRPLRLYADLPQAIRRGWPGWVSGEAEEPGVSASWAGTLAAAGLAVPRLVPRVHPLGADARRRKLDTIARYRTQRPALDVITFRPLADPQTLAYEVTWEVPPDALPSGDGRAEAAREPLVAEAAGDPVDDLA